MRTVKNSNYKLKVHILNNFPKRFLLFNLLYDTHEYLFVHCQKGHARQLCTVRNTGTFTKSDLSGTGAVSRE